MSRHKGAMCVTAKITSNQAQQVFLKGHAMWAILQLKISTLQPTRCRDADVSNVLYSVYFHS